MKIESIIKRDGGTRVHIGQKEYHFKPDAEGRHVAEVEDDEHAERLLSIEEGYREASAGTDPASPMSPEEKALATERAALAEQFKLKFNKKPHPQMSIEKLREAVENGIA